MARKLTNLKVDMISLVKNPANGEQVTVFKSADHPSSTEGTEPTQDQSGVAKAETVVDDGADTGATTPSTEPADASQEVTEPGTVIKDATTKQGILKSVKKFLSDMFGEEVEVGKAADIDDSMDWASFTSMMNNPRRQTFKACYVLEDVLSEIFWNDNIENGKELIAQNIDEFKAYVMAILDGPVDVAKTQFTEAFTSKSNSNEEEDEDMSAEQIAKAVSEAMAPIAKSVSDLTAKVEGLVATEETVTKSAETGAEGADATETGAVETTEAADGVAKSAEVDIASIVKSALEPVVKSVADLSDKVTAIENVRPVSKSGEFSGVQKSAEATSDWPLEF